MLSEALHLQVDAMEQKHPEQTIKHTDDQQDTGNHNIPGSPDANGADRFGGTRAGAENEETVVPDKHERGRV